MKEKPMGKKENLVEQLEQQVQYLSSLAKQLRDELIEPPPTPEPPPEPPPPVEPNDRAVVVTFIWYEHKPPELTITAHPVNGRTPMGILWRKGDQTVGFDRLKTQLRDLLADHLRIK